MWINAAIGMILGIPCALFASPVILTEVVPDGPYAWVERFGIAGLAMFILFWFLRSLVRDGVKPFVAGTLANQDRFAAALEGLEKSTRDTVAIVQSMHERLEHHVTSDERIDAEIVGALREIRSEVAPHKHGGG